MQFSEIIAQHDIKTNLEKGIDSGRIPHAQVFIGPEGSGTLPMAIAYAHSILSQNNNNNDLKFKKLTHPDLHFIYPTITTEEVKQKAKSIDFINQWREFVAKNPYSGLFDWYNLLGSQNKQGLIRVEDAHDILKTISLKSYEGGFKIIIIWMAEKMNVEASNKLLKILEDPPEKTVFLLISENEEAILQTIRSRCQAIYFKKLQDEEIVEALVSGKEIDKEKAIKVAKQSNGNYNLALQLIHEDENNFPFEKWFITWVRSAFRAKGNASAILNLVQWSDEIAGIGRETQKNFLLFCIDMFRQAMLFNYETKKLVYFEPKDEVFKLENFAPFVNGNNIEEIFHELSTAIYHIERNGNAKIILTDLSIKLTRLIHKT